MIFIITLGLNETTTDLVIRWIKSFDEKISILRFNKEDRILELSFDINREEFDLLISKKTANGFKDFFLNSRGITNYWYRKANIYLNFDFSLFTKNQVSVGDAKRSLKSTLWDEWKILNQYFHFILKKKKGLGDYNLASPNKLKMLSLAIDAGLDVPNTKVVNSAKGLSQISNPNGLITKAMFEATYLEADNKNYLSYTEKLSQENYINSNRFFPSLIQENINKAFELRIFYLSGTCFSMAIFSQLDRQTETDFRRYNDSKPNRMVPYSLPNKISSKIHQFMKSAGLDTGSIDMIVTDTSNFIFLEVNPVGQFGMVSNPCNYYLENKIAKFLTQHEE